MARRGARSASLSTAIRGFVLGAAALIAQTPHRRCLAADGDAARTGPAAIFGGTLGSGRVLDYYDRPADKRRLCSLYLSLMDRMGVELLSFGDADERLAGI